MRDDARIQTTIDAINAIATENRPADGTLMAFFRERRYIGSKDRRAIAERAWRILRSWARASWWVRRIAQQTWAREKTLPEWDTTTARQRVIIDLIIEDKVALGHVRTLFSGNPFAPARLSDRETALAHAAHGQTLCHPDQPLWVRGESPEWVVDLLAPFYGERLPALLDTLSSPGSADLRVNSLKTDRDSALQALRIEGIEATPTRWSPLGLRLNARYNLASTETFRNGSVETQDEGSQLVALMTGAAPGHAVCDFCAGAGGKTLALAAMMQNKGRLVACDISEGRLNRSATRLKRAGAHNVTRRSLSGDNDKWIKRSAETFDRVLVDAPCSGTGTWRRNPDAKWRMGKADLTRLTDLQAGILHSASRLTKVGGRLTYATCSLLPEENETQIEGFLDRNSRFRLLSIVEASGGVLPFSGSMLRLDPLEHGTDGFFVATLERTG